MADLNQTPLMDIRVVVLYPTHITQLASRHGVRFRSRQKTKCTLVPCAIESLDGRSIATPEYAIPAGTPAPKYRLQFETTRRRSSGGSLALAARCVEHLAGAIDLFPMRDRAYVAEKRRIPEGEANLSFNTAKCHIAKSPNHDITKS